MYGGKVCDPSFLWGGAGFFYQRARDVENRMFSSKTRKEKRTYIGKKPVLDLHFYRHDFLYPMALFIFLAFHAIVTKNITKEDLVGRWSLNAGSPLILGLRNNGLVVCELGERRIKAGSFGVTGNLFDGYFLSITRESKKENECTEHLIHFLNKKQRFSMKGTSICFHNTELGGWLRKE